MTKEELIKELEQAIKIANIVPLAVNSDRRQILGEDSLVVHIVGAIAPDAWT